MKRDKSVEAVIKRWDVSCSLKASEISKKAQPNWNFFDNKE